MQYKNQCHFNGHVIVDFVATRHGCTRAVETRDLTDMKREIQPTHP